LISPPLVSVVVATYNYGRYLAGALDSVLGQTLSDFEVIVVDDGSTDETPRIVEGYRNDPRVRYLRTDHLGQPAAKNGGIRAATGRFVAFLDADDQWLPTKLEKQLALFRDDPGLGVVYCRRHWIDERGREFNFEERPPHRGDVLAQVFWRSFICFSSSVVRRAVFEDIGLFDETIPLAIDYDLWLRAALKYRFDFVDERLVRYRTGHANLSRRQGERVACVWRIIDKFLNELGGRDRIEPALVRLTKADLYCDMAGIQATESWLSALGSYCRALMLRPGHPTAWRGLLVSWWPESLKERMRTVLGRHSRRSYPEESANVARRETGPKS
jgi:glycosyltransferase involved in cell wall biosynthesis